VTTVLVGGVAALALTGLMRVISAEVAAWRILRAGWRELARLAVSPRPPNPRQFAARMHDRLGLLLPRLAQAATRNPELRLADALRDLHIGYNLSQLIEASIAQPPACRSSLEELRRALSGWFASMARGHIVPPPTQARERLDAVIALLLQQPPAAARQLGITAAVGLTRNLVAAASPAEAGAL
jgi:CRP-like cAMP-binding protein